MNGGAALPAAIVFAGSGTVSAAVRNRLPADADVIAADSGLAVATALGVPVDHLVGDLDSVDPAAVQAAEAAGTTVDRHPVEKDATDLELALDAARARGARRLVVVDGGGDRLDHLLGNVLLLSSAAYAATDIEAFSGDAHIAVARGGGAAVTITGEPGSLVTLLPVGGAARGIVTDGLRYPLHAEDLAPGTTRGVSNELLGDAGSVRLADGTLLVVQPFGGAR